MHRDQQKNWQSNLILAKWTKDKRSETQMIKRIHTSSKFETASLVHWVINNRLTKKNWQWILISKIWTKDKQSAIKMIKRIAQAQIPTTALIFRERIYLTNNKTLPVLVHHDEQKKKKKAAILLRYFDNMNQS